MMPPIPALLFRGDADRNNVRDLKATLHHYQLQTNLLKSGDGHAIFTTPINVPIARHVDPGWAKTHFLSFSDDKTTALRFGMDCEYDDIDHCLENYAIYPEEGSDWTFVIITIDTTIISWKETATGIYHGSYESGLRKFAIFPGQSHIVLIDVRKAIEAFPDHPRYEQVIANATRDTEWLMLPASQTILNEGNVEFSGIMDGRCISDIEKYKYNRIA